jgi:hypothetical protein
MQRSWLDIRRSNPDHEKLRDVMEKRVIDVKNLGCDAIEFDNVDVCEDLDDYHLAFVVAA